MRTITLTILLSILAWGTPALAAGPSDFVTNIGQSVLSRSDLVVTGSLSKTVRQVAGMFRRNLVVDRALWGETKELELTITYSDPASFDDKDKGVVVALASIGSSKSTFSLIGRRMQTDDSELVPAITAYIAIEKAEEKKAGKVTRLTKTIKKHLKQGGVAAGIAVIELVFMVKNHSDRITHELYTSYRKLSLDVNEPQVRSDLKLALQGMVELTLKIEAQVTIRKGDTDQEKKEALLRLEGYLKHHPRAFTEKDARRCKLLAKDAPREIATSLARLKKDISRTVNARKLDGDKKKKITAPETRAPFAATEDPDRENK